MSFDAGSVVARIKADLTDFQAGLKKAQEAGKTMSDKIKSGVDGMNKGIAGMEPQLKKAGIAFTAVAAAGGLMLKDWTGSASGAEVAMAKFNATLATMGDEGLKAKDALLAAAGAAVQMGFDDEDAAVALSTLFQRTKDVAESTKLLALAQDLARAKSIDLTTATTLVGQVLSGNSKVLKAYDIDLKETANPLEALGQLHEKIGPQAALFMETNAGKTEKLAISYGNLKETLGGALLPVMDQLQGVLQRAVDWFNELSPSVQNTVAYFVLFATVAAGILAPLTGFVLLIPTLTAGLGTIATLVGAISWPLVAVIALITALGVAWTTNLFGIQEKTAIFFQMLTDTVTYFRFAWESDWFYMQTVVTTVFEFIYNWFLIYWETFKMLFKVTLLLLQGNWKDAFSAMQNWAKSVFDIVSKHASAFWEGLTAAFTAGGAILGGLWSSFMDGIRNVTKSVWEGVKQMFVDSINWIIAKMNRFIDALNGMSGSLGRALGLGKQGFSMGRIPALASGGIVTRPTLAMIGEGGEPEAVIPLSKLGDTGAGGVHIHVDGAIIGSVDAAVDLLDMAIRRVRPSLGV